MTTIFQTNRWQKISTAALELGADPRTIKQWAYRKVPGQWRIDIVQHTGGMVSFQDFRDIDKGEWKE